MGYFRCLSKPCKRKFFAYADRRSELWMERVICKYTQKYIYKIHKLNRYILPNPEVVEGNPDQYNRVPGLDLFIYELSNKLNKEKGIGHSKVREYWLRRGPRLFMVLVFTILLTIGMGVLLLKRTRDENIFSLLVGLNLIICSVYMLYQRLDDSISGTMMRIGHDYYASWKSETLPKIVNPKTYIII